LANYSVNRTQTRYAGSRRLPQALGNNQITSTGGEFMQHTKISCGRVKARAVFGMACVLAVFTISGCSENSDQADASASYTTPNKAGICSTMRNIARTVKTNADAGRPMSAQLAAYTTGDAKTDKITHTIVIAAYTSHVQAESTDAFVGEMDTACQQAF